MTVSPALTAPRSIWSPREKIIADLDAMGRLSASSRTNSPCRAAIAATPFLEPLLTDQWFVDIKPLAAPAIRAG